MASSSSGLVPPSSAHGPLGNEAAAPPRVDAPHDTNPNPNLHGQPSSPSKAKSFASLFKDNAAIIPSIPMISASSHYGEPALKFPKEVVSVLAKPFIHTLIGKFPKGRPNMDEARRCFLKFGLKADFKLGHIDAKHILIRPYHEADFTRLWAKESWFVGRFQMKVFRWTPNWRPDQESSLFPVWVGLPGLPIHLFNKMSLFSIAKIFGEPLGIDNATANLTRPSMAKVLVQVDLLKKLPSRIFIECGDCEGFFQYLEYDNLPSYCKHCFKVGHSIMGCRFANKGKENKEGDPKITMHEKNYEQNSSKGNLNTEGKQQSESKNIEDIGAPKKVWQRIQSKDMEEGEIPAPTSVLEEPMITSLGVEKPNYAQDLAGNGTENNGEGQQKVMALKPILKQSVDNSSNAGNNNVTVALKPKSISSLVSNIVVDEVARAAQRCHVGAPIRGNMVDTADVISAVHNPVQVGGEDEKMDEEIIIDNRDFNANEEENIVIEEARVETPNPTNGAENGLISEEFPNKEFESKFPKVAKRGHKLPDAVNKALKKVCDEFLMSKNIPVVQQNHVEIPTSSSTEQNFGENDMEKIMRNIARHRETHPPTVFNTPEVVVTAPKKSGIDPLNLSPRAPNSFVTDMAGSTPFDTSSKLNPNADGFSMVTSRKWRGRSHSPPNNY